MGLRYRPRLSIGKNIRIGKTGISFLTGIPGLSYRYNFNSGASTASANDTDKRPALPTIEEAIINIILLSFILFLSVSWGAALWKPLGYIIPLLFIGRAYKPLFKEYNYGLKSQAIYKRDLRFKDGQRYMGSRLVEDQEQKIYFTPKQRTIARIEGTIKFFMIGLTILFVATTPDKLISQPNAPLSIKNLTVGDSVSKLKRQEKVGLDSFSENWYYKEHVSYAKEKGKLDFHLEKGILQEIKFTPTDTAAYPRLANLLISKYGTPQDSTASSLAWENDSLTLKLSKLVGVELQLHKSGILH